MLRDLLVNRLGTAPAGEPAVVVRDVVVRDPLDLAGLDFPKSLLFERCEFRDGIRLDDASLVALTLHTCRASHLTAPGLELRGDLVLIDSRFGVDDGKSLGDLPCTCHDAPGPGEAESQAPPPPDPPGAAAPAAVTLTGARIRALRGGDCHVHGRMDLTALQVTHDLDVPGWRFFLPGDTALVADRVSVGGDANLRDCHVHGALDMILASVTGYLTLNKTEICGKPTLDLHTGPERLALNLDGTTVGHMVYLMDGFRADGMVRAIGLCATNYFGISGRIENPGSTALHAQRLSCRGAVVISTDDSSGSREPTRIDGAIRLDAARIDGGLVLDRTVVLPGGIQTRERQPRRYWLYARDVAAGRLFLGDTDFRRSSGADEPLVDISEAAIGVLDDDLGRWPSGEGSLRLRGLTYRAFGDQAAGDASERLKWLARQCGYVPQPYQQLAAVYRAAGDRTAAVRVEIARRKHRRRTLPIAIRPFDAAVHALLGYGYRIWVLALALVVVYGGGVLAFHVIPADFTPRNPALAGDPPSPWLYTLDWLVPVLNLQQRTTWAPQGWESVVAVALAVVGWLSTALLIAAATGVVKRE
ncbi:hypothetical protein [Modestobacter sp. SYSU DS0511]